MLVRPPAASWESNELQGKKCGMLVTLADIMPTILNIAGIDGTKIEMDGCDMLALLENEKSNNIEDRVFYGNMNGVFLSVMKGGYKYMWAKNGGEELLFNIAEDPMEQRDLSKIKPGLAAEMKQMIAERMKNCSFDATEPIKSPNDVPKWPGFHSTYYPCDVLH